MPKMFRVMTAEQVVIEYPMAGIGSRAIAFFIDTVLILLIEAIIVTALFLSRMTTNTYIGLHSLAAGFLLFVVMLLPLFYFVLLEGLWGGQTIGKRLTNQRVIGTRGHSVSLFAALIRNLILLVDFLPGGFLVGIVFILVTKNEQRLGDLAAGTIVVLEGSKRHHRLALEALRSLDENQK